MFRRTTHTSKRTRLGRPTPAMAVACTALFMALGGVGYAAATIGSSQIKNNSVQGKDIKNSTIKTADISKGTRNSLKGQSGPAGSNGANGAKGDVGGKGDKGDRGPSTAYGAHVAGSVTVAGANPVEVIGGSVPAGSYVFQAKLVLKSESANGSRPSCELFVLRGDLLEVIDRVGNVLHSPKNTGDDTAEYTLQALTKVDDTSNGYGVRCEPDPISPMSANQRSIVATQVGAINP